MLFRSGGLLARRMYYSVGGGFVVDEDEAGSNSRTAADHAILPYDFASVIYLVGGPPHQDLFDLKPFAPSEIAGPWKPI